MCFDHYKQTHDKTKQKYIHVINFFHTGMVKSTSLFLYLFLTFSISMYIMCVCLFSALSRRVGALQISIIIITIICFYIFVSAFSEGVLFCASSPSACLLCYEGCQRSAKKDVVQRIKRSRTNIALRVDGGRSSPAARERQRPCTE